MLLFCTPRTAERLPAGEDCGHCYCTHGAQGRGTRDAAPSQPQGCFRLARARRGFGRPRAPGGLDADARRLCGLLALARARRGFGRPRDHGGHGADARRAWRGGRAPLRHQPPSPSTPRREPQGARGRTKTRARTGHAHKSPPSRARRGQTRRGRGDGQRRGRAQCTPKAALGLAGCSVPCAASIRAACAVAVSRVPRPSVQFVLGVQNSSLSVKI